MVPIPLVMDQLVQGIYLYAGIQLLAIPQRMTSCIALGCRLNERKMCPRKCKEPNAI